MKYKMNRLIFCFFFVLLRSTVHHAHTTFCVLGSSVTPVVVFLRAPPPFLTHIL